MKKLAFFVLALFSATTSFAIQTRFGGTSSGGGSSVTDIYPATATASFPVGASVSTLTVNNQIYFPDTGYSNESYLFSVAQSGQNLGAKATTPGFGSILDLFNDYTVGNSSYLSFSGNGGSVRTLLGYIGFSDISQLSVQSYSGTEYMRFVYGTYPYWLFVTESDAAFYFGGSLTNEMYFDKDPISLMRTSMPWVFNSSITANNYIIANTTTQFNDPIWDNTSSAGTLNQVLASNGSTLPPTWKTQSGAAGGGYALEPTTVTINAAKGALLSTITVTGLPTFNSSSFTINGLPYTNWPSALSTIGPSSTGVFVVNGSSQVSIQPAILDAAQLSSTQSFTGGNLFLSSVTIPVTSIIGNPDAIGEIAISSVAISTSMGTITSHDGVQQFYVVPTTNTPTVTGMVPVYSATTKKVIWGPQTASSGSGTPGGSTTEIQFNNAGSFAGVSVATFNSTTNLLTLSSAVTHVNVGGDIYRNVPISMTGTSSITVQSSVTAAGFFNRSNGIFVSTFSSTALNGFSIYASSGAIAAGASITITIPGTSTLWFPMVTELEDINTAGTSVRIKSIATASYVIFNADVINAKKYITTCFGL